MHWQLEAGWKDDRQPEAAVLCCARLGYGRLRSVYYADDWSCDAPQVSDGLRANAVHLPPILPAATATTEPCHFAGAPMDARNGKWGRLEGRRSSPLRAGQRWGGALSARPPARPLPPPQSPGSSVEKTDSFLASMRWLGFLKFYPEVGLEVQILSVHIPHFLMYLGN